MKRRMLGTAVLGFASALLIAGCSAGQITQTGTQEAAVNGAPAQVGSIAIRNAQLTVPAGSGVVQRGGDADVTMSIINEGTTDDQLVSASSDAASSVFLGSTRTVPAGNTLVMGPGQPASPSGGEGELTLQGLNRTVYSGQMVELTLTFRDAGRVTFDVPAAAPEAPREGAGAGAEQGH